MPESDAFSPQLCHLLCVCVCVCVYVCVCMHMCVCVCMCTLAYSDPFILVFVPGVEYGLLCVYNVIYESCLKACI